MWKELTGIPALHCMEKQNFPSVEATQSLWFTIIFKKPLNQHICGKFFPAPAKFLGNLKDIYYDGIIVCRTMHIS
jgi:hypothetical protein